jgi:hypothetical protein
MSERRPAALSTYHLVVLLRLLHRAGREGSDLYQEARAELDRRSFNEKDDAFDEADVFFGTVAGRGQQQPEVRGDGR